MIVFLVSQPLRADVASVAVATNFVDVAEQLQTGFEAGTGHELRLISGSTGKLYAQIRHGAPYDVFLAADGERPARLEQDGFAVPGTRFTYAVGRLVLWSAKKTLVSGDGVHTLKAMPFRHLAMANPDLAPYGTAARQVLKHLDLWTPLQGRIVMGENIGQTYAMVASGNAELGFVALASVSSLPPSNSKGQRGSLWLVPAHMHETIRQDAQLLQRGTDNPAGSAFLTYLQTDEALKLIEQAGYGGGDDA